MARPLLRFALNRDARVTLPTQLAQSIAADIKRGRLGPGDRLPGTRALAETLGVHRNTVLAAYAELAAEGWVRSTDGLGTFIASELPVGDRESLGRSAKRVAMGFSLPAANLEPDVSIGEDVTILDWGVPDVRLFPAAPLARAYRRALLGRPRDLLQYSRSSTPLAGAIERLLSDTRGIVFEAKRRLLLTRGSQMALYLVARSLLRPGDVVAVEDPGYGPAWQAFRAAGAEVVGIPVDKHGISIDALRQVVARRAVRALFVTPHHQYPTTAALSASRKIELLRLAAEKRMVVVEDDCDHEFHYDGGAVLPLASDDRAGVVVYVGSLSKVLAPGLRVGYMAGPAPLVRRAELLRETIELQGDRVLETAVAELIEDGEVARHLRRSRRIYGARRDALAARLEEELGDVVSFDVPAGGLALWLRVAPRIDVDAWSERARADSLYFRTGETFSLAQERLPCLRLGFGMRNEDEMVAMVARLRRALPRSRSSAKQ